MVKQKSHHPNRRRASKSSHSFSNPARSFLLFLIPLLAIIVTASIICTILLNPERQVHQQLEALADNYYQNTFYADMLNSDKFSGDPEKALEKYQATGLSTITLSQLLLLSNADTATTNFFAKYCDLSETSIKFYPEPPYSVTSYHAKYTYACDF